MFSLLLWSTTFSYHIPQYDKASIRLQQQTVSTKIMEVLQWTSKPDEVINNLTLFNVCLVTAFVRANLEGLQEALAAKSV